MPLLCYQNCFCFLLKITYLANLNISMVYDIKVISFVALIYDDFAFTVFHHKHGIKNITIMVKKMLIKFLLKMKHYEN